jgi:hypothetical protein
VDAGQSTRPLLALYENAILAEGIMPPVLDGDRADRPAAAMIAEECRAADL